MSSGGSDCMFPTDIFFTVLRTTHPARIASLAATSSLNSLPLRLLIDERNCFIARLSARSLPSAMRSREYSNERMRLFCPHINSPCPFEIRCRTGRCRYDKRRLKCHGRTSVALVYGGGGWRYSSLSVKVFRSTAYSALSQPHSSRC